MKNSSECQKVTLKGPLLVQLFKWAAPPPRKKKRCSDRDIGADVTMESEAASIFIFSVARYTSHLHTPVSALSATRPNVFVGRSVSSPNYKAAGRQSSWSGRNPKRHTNNEITWPGNESTSKRINRPKKWIKHPTGQNKQKNCVVLNKLAVNLILSKFAAVKARQAAYPFRRSLHSE